MRLAVKAHLLAFRDKPVERGIFPFILDLDLFEEIELAGLLPPKVDVSLELNLRFRYFFIDLLLLVWRTGPKLPE